MKRITITLLFLPCLLCAQDIHFTQWMYHPVFSNPATSGFFDGEYRIHAQQRSQWGSVSVPFTSTSLGMDMSLKGVGLGGLLLLDNAGTSSLNTTQFNLTGAYQLGTWRGGLQLGFAQRSIDYSNLLFPDGNESFDSESKSFLDVGVGLLKTIEVSFDKSLELGMAHFHFNKPNTSFIENADKLKMRHQLQANLYWQLTDYWQLQPSLMYQQQSTHRELFFGTRAQFDISDYYQRNIKLITAAMFRWGDAVSMLLGAQIENTHLALSYDWNVSDLVPASNGLGAWEISFTHILQQQIPKRPGYKVCPIYL